METEQTVQTNTNEYSSIRLTKRMLSFLIKRNKNKKNERKRKRKKATKYIKMKKQTNNQTRKKQTNRQETKKDRIKE